MCLYLALLCWTMCAHPSTLSCVCSCMCVCECAHGCVGMCACRSHRRQQVYSSTLFPPPYSLETGLLFKPKGSHPGWAGWPASSQACLCLLYLGLETYTAIPSFNVGTGDPDSGPYACVILLPTEASPQDFLKILQSPQSATVQSNPCLLTLNPLLMTNVPLIYTSR